MKVSDILAQTARLLGNEELAAACEAETYDDVQADAEALLGCYNFVEEEIALNYIPVTAEETVDSETGKIYYQSFSHAPLSILRVTSTDGREEEYTVYTEYIRVPAGETVVSYTYSPEKKTLSGDSDYGNRIPWHVLSYGTACEFCLIRGLYEEAVQWDKKFKEGMFNIMKASRPTLVRTRRWA